MDKTMLKFRIEGYKRKVEKKVDDTKKAIGKFVTENPAEATTIALATLATVKYCVKHTDKQRAYKEDQFKQNRTIYDHSTKHRWTTKRNITPEERGEINVRHYRYGEDYYTILSSMNLL